MEYRFSYEAFLSFSGMPIGSYLSDWFVLRLDDPDRDIRRLESGGPTHAAKRIWAREHDAGIVRTESHQRERLRVDCRAQPSVLQARALARNRQDRIRELAPLHPAQGESDRQSLFESNDTVGRKPREHGARCFGDARCDSSCFAAGSSRSELSRHMVP
jgi:hypothetical protein